MEKDDSPVESVRRDMLMDELPFSPKVHRAVQLWRYQRRQRKKKKTSLLARGKHVSAVQLLIRLADLKVATVTSECETWLDNSKVEVSLRL